MRSRVSFAALGTVTDGAMPSKAATTGATLSLSPCSAKERNT